MRGWSAVFYRASLIAEQVLSISGEIVVRTESRVDDENQCAAAQKRYQRAMEKLRDMPLERIHSRKLRSFEETAFL